VKSQLTARGLGRPLDRTLNPWEHLNYFDMSHLDSTLAAVGLERLAASEVAGAVDIGLRSEPSHLRRLKNSLASALRLCRYAATGRAVETTESVFYRKA
jgi:hypothetical protein